MHVYIKTQKTSGNLQVTENWKCRTVLCDLEMAPFHVGKICEDVRTTICNNNIQYLPEHCTQCYGAKVLAKYIHEKEACRKYIL